MTENEIGRMFVDAVIADHGEFVLVSHFLDYAHDKIPGETLAASFQGWEAHARHGNTQGLRRAARADLRKRFREQLREQPNGTH